MKWAALTTKTKATVVVAVAAVVWLGGVGSAGALVGAAASNVAGSHAATVAVATATPTPRASHTLTPTPTPEPVVVETERTQDTAIPFERTTVDDPALAKGQRRITTAGVPGVLTTTWRITTTDGVETGREEVGKRVTRAPVTEVTAVGSYVAPPVPGAPPAPAPQQAPPQQAPASAPGLITPGAFCADAQEGAVAQAANGRSYRCGGKGPDASGHLHWNVM